MIEHAREHARIVKIEGALLIGRRPRHAGCNARLGEHGVTVRAPIVRLTTEDGATGFGRSAATIGQARSILGAQLGELFSPQQGATERGLAFDYPLWDLAGQRAGRPVYELVAAASGQPVEAPLRTPCYDTSLYIDDLHLADDDEAAALIAAEAREGYARGHRAFKIKVGRGARHMPLEAGTRRDVAVIHAVRNAVGPQATIMLDANNGYNLNLTKQVLAETAGCRIFWMEEAFHEDRVLYEDLKTWLQANQLPVLIADGEGQASPSLLEWAQSGMVDVIQYDVFSYGFTPWVQLGARLDGWGVVTAPHHYGGLYGNYAACHLSAAIERFAFAEWDEAAAPGIDTSGYSLQDGYVVTPNLPGFGLTLDAERFQHAVATDGYQLVL